MANVRTVWSNAWHWQPRGGRVEVPPEMGTPRDDQLGGSDLDALAEICGRVCYDSLGSGRSSSAYHKHIREVRHHSVYRHPYLCLRFAVEPPFLADVCLSLVNRPGVYVSSFDGRHLRFVVSSQAVLEWPDWDSAVPSPSARLASELLGRRVRFLFKWQAPLTFAGVEAPTFDGTLFADIVNVCPQTDDETFVSLFFDEVSRGLCYHPDTEVLTRRGWKPVRELRAGEDLLTKDPATGKCRWSKNLRNHSYTHDGEMMSFANSQVSSPLMTPNHLLWCARHDLRRARGLSCEENVNLYAEKVPFEDVFGKSIAIDSRIEMETVKDPSHIEVGTHSYDAEDFFAWLGWILTDGCVSKDRNRCQISQSKPHNVAAIRALMRRLFGDRFKERRQGDREHLFRIHDKHLKQFVVDNFGRTKRSRSLVWLLDYSRRLLQCFWDAAVAGDGNVTNDHEVIYCGYEGLAKDYQSVCAALGRSSNVRVVDIGVDKDNYTVCGRTCTANQLQYVVSAHKKGVSLIRGSKHEATHYRGFVHCPQTEDGLVYVRSQGMSFWAGNTHELVRHTFMCAPSQRSTRYVDEEESSWVMHPEIKKSLRAIKAFEKVLAAGRDGYVAIRDDIQERLAAEGADKLSARKQARGAARGVLGNALNTQIIFTANLRQWKHIIKMRTDPAADLEIRHAMWHANIKLGEAFPGQFPPIQEPRTT